jgi:hypothetical protein
VRIGEAAAGQQRQQAPGDGTERGSGRNRCRWRHTGAELGNLGAERATTGGLQVAVTAAWEIVTGHLRTRLGREALQRWAGAEKRTRDPFSNLIFFCYFDLSSRCELHWKKYLWGLEKYEIFHGIDLNICHNFWMGHFDQRSAIFK